MLEVLQGAFYRKEAMPMPSLLVRAAAALLVLASVAVAAGDAQKVGGVDISEWRGFNLLEKFTLNQNAPYKEDDFKWIAELGFNFVRLPADYRCYVEKDDWLKFKEPVLKEIDAAIALGEKYKIHVCLNLHRAPGFCINPPAEKADLWKDEEALNAFIAHWVMFAKRYKHIPPEWLSFNLLNEPMRNTRENYLKVFCRTIEAIQKEDPRRLIIVDGNNVGSNTTPEFLKYSNVIQATRGYHPATISHYKASWAQGSDKWPEPVWLPGTAPEQTLINYLKPWLEISARGAPVFVGEWGCYNKTPHPVALAWMKSWLEQWKKARFGWALWNFRGSFGILDSGRPDVQYEDWHGHKLDREMLRLLQQYQKY
ncbi:MAG: cellulase family glycosylhydrolase [Planctomycetota bacterium]|nr:cellulase family glycosylhydrolase [Planctomycetota bacterium]